jgi:MerR family transcriptional regulator, mercuric resistance operon regulatory protein
MTALRTISELASLAELPGSTIRFYERRGLLHAERRSASGYRLYGAASLERLRFIKAAQATGFSLDDVRDLLALSPGDPDTRAGVREKLERRLAEVRGRIAELRTVEEALTLSLEACTSAGCCPCPVLQKLRVSAAAGQVGRDGSAQILVQA